MKTWIRLEVENWAVCNHSPNSILSHPFAKRRFTFKIRFLGLSLAVKESGSGFISGASYFIQMLSFNCFLLYIKQPLSFPQPPFFLYKKLAPTVALRLGHGDNYVVTKTSTNHFSPSSYCVVHAVEKDSQQYDLNPDEAKEALRKLDQQLQDLSKKQLSPPRIKAADVKLTRDQATEEVPELPGSVLIYWTVGLFLFTFFYNVLFYSVIKPSIDGEERAPAPTTTVEIESPDVAVLQLLPSIPEVFLHQHQGGGY